MLDTISPNRAFYPSFNMASTRAAIRSTPVEDFYVVPSENLSNGDAGLRILVNPLIWWMWVAGPVMILGTVIALWPEPSRVPARVAPRSAAFPPYRRLLGLLLPPSTFPRKRESRTTGYLCR